jgi:hypothetical protein
MKMEMKTNSIKILYSKQWYIETIAIALLLWWTR